MLIGDHVFPSSIDLLYTSSVLSKSSHPGVLASLKAIRVPFAVFRSVGILKQAYPSVWDVNGMLEM